MRFLFKTWLGRALIALALPLLVIVSICVFYLPSRQAHCMLNDGRWADSTQAFNNGRVAQGVCYFRVYIGDNFNFTQLKSIGLHGGDMLSIRSITNGFEVYFKNETLLKVTGNTWYWPHLKGSGWKTHMSISFSAFRHLQVIPIKCPKGRQLLPPFVSFKDTMLLSKVAALRQKRNLTQDQLADKTGLSIDTIGAIERGRRWARLTILRQLAKGLGVTTDELCMRYKFSLFYAVQ